MPSVIALGAQSQRKAGFVGLESTAGEFSQKQGRTSPPVLTQSGVHLWSECPQKHTRFNPSCVVVR
jgi:hypothetical protein